MKLKTSTIYVAYRTTIALSLSLVAGLDLFAQEAIPVFSPPSSFRTWSIGVSAGLLNQYNLQSLFPRDFQDIDHQLGYGLYLKKQLSPAFGLRANYVGGKLSGSNAAEAQSFDTKLPGSFTLGGELLFGNISWRHRNSVIKPYLQAQVGILWYESSLVNNAGVTEQADTRRSMVVPVGVGFKIVLSKGLFLDLGYDVQIANASTVDGLDRNRKDIFSYIHGGLEFVLGPKSKPAMSNHNPVEALERRHRAEYDLLKREFEEGKVSKERIIRLEKELTEMKKNLDELSKDSDGDGVADKFDKCPNTPVGQPVDGAGCPLPDVSNDAPDAFKTITFALGKSDIDPVHFEALDLLAKVMIAKPLRMQITGHTDNTGSAGINEKLSLLRANAVKEYLTNRGVESEKIIVKGHSYTNPILSNSTAMGRETNRRVEFVFY